MVVALTGAHGIDSRSERLRQGMHSNMWSFGLPATASVGHWRNAKKSAKATPEYFGSSGYAVNPRRDLEAEDTPWRIFACSTEHTIECSVDCCPSKHSHFPQVYSNTCERLVFQASFIFPERPASTDQKVVCCKMTRFPATSSFASKRGGWLPPGLGINPNPLGMLIFWSYLTEQLCSAANKGIA